MKFSLFAVLLFVFLSAAFSVAQDSNTGAQAPNNSKPDKNWITVQGCVTRATGDYVLIKENPGNSFELQPTAKIHLHDYLGQRVEVSGPQSPTLSSSTDASRRSASPVTITVKSIKTLDKECPAL